MKRRASRLEGVGMRKHRPDRNRLGGSKRNTSGTERCSIWRRGTCIVESSWDDARRRRDQAVWSVGGSGAGAGPLQGCNTVILHRGQRLVASRPDVGGAYASV